MISKKASAIKLEELAAPLTYIPNAKPKSQSILTGIVRIVTIIEIVMSSRVLCEHKKNVYPIKKTQQYHAKIWTNKNKKNL